MRLSLRSNSLVEWLALRTGLVPTPAAEAWGGMALSGVLVAATRLGVTTRLATGAVTAADLAVELRLEPTAVQLLLDCLRSSGHVICRAGRYKLSRASRRWLDPESELSVAQFVASTADYWTWWSNLPDVVRTGSPYRHHDAPPDDPYWRRYIMGQFELARLSAAEVGSRLKLPPDAMSLLDLGGGHGWYSAELCRRYPLLDATVLDLPGSARIGREIVAAADLIDRVHHREADVLADDLGGPYDIVLCFNLIHHLRPHAIIDLFTRVLAALAPGGVFAVMDAFADPLRRTSAAGNFLGLFLYLSSGGQVYTPTQLNEWLDAAGFAPPRRTSIRRIPGETLYQTRARP